MASSTSSQPAHSGTVLRSARRSSSVQTGCAGAIASLALDELERVRREQLVAVGSCSFFEPVDDLKQLGIL